MVGAGVGPNKAALPTLARSSDRQLPPDFGKARPTAALTTSKSVLSRMILKSLLLTLSKLLPCPFDCSFVKRCHRSPANGRATAHRHPETPSLMSSTLPDVSCVCRHAASFGCFCFCCCTAGPAPWTPVAVQCWIWSRGSHLCSTEKHLHGRRHAPGWARAPRRA